MYMTLCMSVAKKHAFMIKEAQISHVHVIDYTAYILHDKPYHCNHDLGL